MTNTATSAKTPKQARRRGFTAGLLDVDMTAQEQGIDVVIATLKPGQPSWDWAAINVDAAGCDRVPERLRRYYYAEYARAADHRARQYARGEIALGAPGMTLKDVMQWANQLGDERAPDEEVDAAFRAVYGRAPNDDDGDYFDLVSLIFAGLPE